MAPPTDNSDYYHNILSAILEIQNPLLFHTYRESDAIHEHLHRFRLQKQVLDGAS